MMDQVHCLYCGKRIPADAQHCPHCGALSHYQQRGWRQGVRRRYLIIFILIVAGCFFFAFWLPR